MTPEHITRILNWPPETWSDQEKQHVQEYRTQLHAALRAVADQAEREDRDLSAEESERFEGLQGEFDQLGERLSVIAR